MTSQLEARYTTGVRPCDYQNALKLSLLEGDLSGALENKKRLAEALCRSNGGGNLFWRVRNICKQVLVAKADDLVSGQARAKQVARCVEAVLEPHTFAMLLERLNLQHVALHS